MSINPALVLFAINSVISQWLDARADIRDRQVTIRQQDHAYLKRDSFLNCTEAIRQMEIEDVERQLIEDTSNVKDMITASEREAILYAAKDCRTLSKKEIQWITEALSV